MTNPINAISKSILLTSALAVMALPALAEEEMDVDQSNSLDFEAFHQKKADAIKLYDSEDGGLLNTAKPSSQETEETTTQVENGNVEKQGKRYEIRELYATSRSERTGYNPNTVVQALHLQMQGFCPSGWRKLDEWSKPDGDAFYMHYQFECL